MNNEFQEKLVELAHKRTTPFCYGCHIKAPKGVCLECHSDDLMRHLDDTGCEWGTEWAIKYILEEELTPIDLEEIFEESVRQCYPEQTSVGWAKFDTVELLKSQDPVAWRCALSEYESQEESDGTIISFDGGITHYWTSEVEKLLEAEN